MKKGHIHSVVYDIAVDSFVPEWWSWPKILIGSAHLRNTQADRHGSMGESIRSQESLWPVRFKPSQFSWTHSL